MKKITLLGLIVLLVFLISCTPDGESLVGEGYKSGKDYKNIQKKVEIKSLDVSQELKDNTLCGKGIKKGIPLTFGEHTLDYCEYLGDTENGINYHFLNKGNELMIYTVRNIDGTDYLLDYVQSNFSKNKVALVYKKENIIVNAFNKKNVSLSVEPCDSKNIYCLVYGKKFPFLPAANFTFAESEHMEAYFDNALFSSENIKKEYIKDNMKRQEASFNFVKEQFGFNPPVEKMGFFQNLNPDGALSATLFTIHVSSDEKISSIPIGKKYSSNHEFAHAFRYGTPVKMNTNWFEEGLAQYIEILARDKPSFPICEDNGWHSEKEETIVPYSNFSFSAPYVSGDNHDDEVYSGICFWMYINQTYGSEGIKKVAQAWDNTRKTLPPKDKWLIKDIVNPALNANLSSLVQKRYSYIEE